MATEKKPGMSVIRLDTNGNEKHDIFNSTSWFDKVRLKWYLTFMNLLIAPCTGDAFVLMDSARYGPIFQGKDGKSYMKEIEKRKPAKKHVRHSIEKQLTTTS